MSISNIYLSTKLSTNLIKLSGTRILFHYWFFSFFSYIHHIIKCLNFFKCIFFRMVHELQGSLFQWVQSWQSTHSQSEVNALHDKMVEISMQYIASNHELFNVCVRACVRGACVRVWVCACCYVRACVCVGVGVLYL